MLVLTRRKGQSINIGDNIRLVVLDVSGDSVRLGIDAPPEVGIYRNEIYLKLRQENLESLASKDLVAELKVMSGQNE